MIWLVTWLVPTTIVFFALVIVGAKELKKLVIMNKYKIMLELLKYFMDQAYDVAYRNQIFSYSSNGTGVPPQELETIQRQFIKMTLDLMGPVNRKELSSFFGGDICLIQNITIYANNQLANDEILKQVTASHRNISLVK